MSCLVTSVPSFASSFIHFIHFLPYLSASASPTMNVAMSVPGEQGLPCLLRGFRRDLGAVFLDDRLRRFRTRALAWWPAVARLTEPAMIRSSSDAFSCQSSAGFLPSADFVFFFSFCSPPLLSMDSSRSFLLSHV
ncbi:hypothetical protein ABZX51_007714 [Aspergillus tubingensis]